MKTTAGRHSGTASGAMLRLAVPPTIAVGIACIALSAVASGRAGFWGALAGTLLVVAFFTITLLALGATRELDPMLTLMVALFLYTIKVIALAVTFVVLDRTGVLGDQLDRTALGVTVIVCTLTWTVLEVVAAVRHREPLYDLGETR